jgi:hypothetical protein
MGPRGFWIALAIVLFYLIARPHIATVWYVTANPTPTPGPTCQAPPAFGCVPPTPSPPPVSHFAEQLVCVRYLVNTIYYRSYRCVDHPAPLWGW